jgi:hypothetical protein
MANIELVGRLFGEQNLASFPKRGKLLYVSFNQDFGCFSCGTGSNARFTRSLFDELFFSADPCDHCCWQTGALIYVGLIVAHQTDDGFFICNSDPLKERFRRGWF